MAFRCDLEHKCNVLYMYNTLRSDVENDIQCTYNNAGESLAVDENGIVYHVTLRNVESEMYDLEKC